MKKLRQTAFSVIMLAALSEGCAAHGRQCEILPAKVCSSSHAGLADKAQYGPKPDAAEMERRLQSLRARVADAQEKMDALRKKYRIRGANR